MLGRSETHDFMPEAGGRNNPRFHRARRLVRSVSMPVVGAILTGAFLAGMDSDRVSGKSIEFDRESGNIGEPKLRNSETISETLSLKEAKDWILDLDPFSIKAPNHEDTYNLHIHTSEVDIAAVMRIAEKLQVVADWRPDGETPIDLGLTALQTMDGRFVVAGEGLQGYVEVGEKDVEGELQFEDIVFFAPDSIRTVRDENMSSVGSLNPGEIVAGTTTKTIFNGVEYTWLQSKIDVTTDNSHIEQVAISNDEESFGSILEIKLSDLKFGFEQIDPEGVMEITRDSKAWTYTFDEETDEYLWEEVSDIGAVVVGGNSLVISAKDEVQGVAGIMFPKIIRLSGQDSMVETEAGIPVVFSDGSSIDYEQLRYVGMGSTLLHVDENEIRRWVKFVNEENLGGESGEEDSPVVVESYPIGGEEFYKSSSGKVTYYTSTKFDGRYVDLSNVPPEVMNAFPVEWRRQQNFTSPVGRTNTEDYNLNLLEFAEYDRFDLVLGKQMDFPAVLEDAAGADYENDAYGASIKGFSYMDGDERVYLMAYFLPDGNTGEQLEKLGARKLVRIPPELAFNGVNIGSVSGSGLPKPMLEKMLAGMDIRLGSDTVESN